MTGDVVEVALLRWDEDPAKAWLATGVFVLVVVQLASPLVLYGRVPGVGGPRWIGGLHRWSGRAAVLLSVPVAVHCLWSTDGLA